MKLIGIIDEDFVNYREPTMSLLFPYCSFKCNRECGRDVCQNSILKDSDLLDVSPETVTDRYLSNPITKAICCYGLEPFDSWKDLKEFIQKFRERSEDTIVIYTGYNEDEVEEKIEWLSSQGNIIVKFGRYIPDVEGVHDDVLGVDLASHNQYAVEL